MDAGKLAHHKYLIENFRVQVTMAKLKDHVDCPDTRKKDLSEDGDRPSGRGACTVPSLKLHVAVGGTDAKSESALKFSLY